MRIYFKRSGGFAGMQLRANLDTASLSDEEAETIEQMLADINFFDLPNEPGAIGGADRFFYELKVVSGEEEHTVCFTDDEPSVKAVALLQHLTMIARRPPEDTSPCVSS